MAGQPTKMTPETLQILNDAFMSGASDASACIQAGICPATLYNYQKENPEYIEQKQLLKGMTKDYAKRVLAKSIRDGDVNSAKYYLDRRDKDFRPKKEATIDGNLTVKTLLEQIIDDDEPKEEQDQEVDDET